MYCAHMESLGSYVLYYMMQHENTQFVEIDLFNRTF